MLAKEEDKKASTSQTQNFFKLNLECTSNLEHVTNGSFRYFCQNNFFDTQKAFYYVTSHLDREPILETLSIAKAYSQKPNEQIIDNLKTAFFNTILPTLHSTTCRGEHVLDKIKNNYQRNILQQAISEVRERKKSFEEEDVLTPIDNTKGKPCHVKKLIDAHVQLINWLLKFESKLKTFILKSKDLNLINLYYEQLQSTLSQEGNQGLFLDENVSLKKAFNPDKRVDLIYDPKDKDLSLTLIKKIIELELFLESFDKKKEMSMILPNFNTKPIFCDFKAAFFKAKHLKSHYRVPAVLFTNDAMEETKCKAVDSVATIAEEKSEEKSQEKETFLDIVRKTYSSLIDMKSTSNSWENESSTLDLFQKDTLLSLFKFFDFKVSPELTQYLLEQTEDVSTELYKDLSSNINTFFKHYFSEIQRITFKALDTTEENFSTFSFNLQESLFIRDVFLKNHSQYARMITSKISLQNLDEVEKNIQLVRNNLTEMKSLYYLISRDSKSEPFDREPLEKEELVRLSDLKEKFFELKEVGKSQQKYIIKKEFSASNYYRLTSFTKCMSEFYKKQQAREDNKKVSGLYKSLVDIKLKNVHSKLSVILNYLEREGSKEKIADLLAFRAAKILFDGISGFTETTICTLSYLSDLSSCSFMNLGYLHDNHNITPPASPERSNCRSCPNTVKRRSPPSPMGRKAARFANTYRIKP